MPRIQADSPFINWTGQGKRTRTMAPSENTIRERKASTHDALCVTISGLSYCWCKCTRCWDALARHCICVACRCRRTL